MKIFWLTKSNIFPRSFNYFLEDANIPPAQICTSPVEAIIAYGNSGADLVIMDFSWYSDEISGVGIMESFLRLYPCLKIVLVTSYYQEVVEDRHIALGAAGYFHKNDLPENIIRHLRQVYNHDQPYGTQQMMTADHDWHCVPA